MPAFRSAAFTLALLIAAPAALAQSADVGGSARAERLRALVVSISVLRRAPPLFAPPREAPQVGSALPGVEDPAIREFFSRFAPQNPANVGAGVIISADGYILTANEVHADAGDYTVRLSDGREFPATVVGADVRTFIGLLKIAASALPAVKMGDSNRLRLEDPVLAIGTRRPLIPAAVPGKVRAFERTFSSQSLASMYVPYLETDVGLIDGPLFNAADELVGLNSMGHAKQVERAWAVPINFAMDIQKDLREHGRVRRGRLGVSIQEVPPEIVPIYAKDKPAGVMVAEVEKDGPADRAGLSPKDIVLAVDGKAVQKSSELMSIIAKLRPGATVNLQIRRGDSTLELKAVAGEVVDFPSARR